MAASGHFDKQSLTYKAKSKQVLSFLSKLGGVQLISRLNAMLYSFNICKKSLLLAHMVDIDFFLTCTEVDMRLISYR